MQGRCCCGCCSLHTGASIALFLTAIEAAVSLFCNIELLLLMVNDETFNPFSMLIDIDTIDDYDVLHGIVLAAIGLNGFWLLSAILAARGNTTLSHGRLTPWVLLTYLITIFNLGVTIYLAVKFQNCIAESQEFFVKTQPTKTLTYLTLLIMFSGGGLLLFLKAYLAHIVELRGKEIDHDYSVLALYILSHLNRCGHVNQECQQSLLPGSPCYSNNCPPYLPPSVLERTIESSGSSWSLSCDNMNSSQLNQTNTFTNLAKKNNAPLAGIRRISHGEPPPAYQPRTVDSSAILVSPY